MIKIITIYNDNINECNIKYNSTNNLYKKCNYKNDTNFNIIKTFSYKDCNIELWGKTKGTNQYKNNNILLLNNNIDIYGKCIFIKKNIQKKLYESLSFDELNIFLNADKKSYSDKVLKGESNQESNQELNQELNKDLNKKLNSKNEDILDYNSSDTELSYDIYSYSSDEEKN